MLGILAGFPHGLERAEDLAGIGIAVVIWASAAFAGYESIRKLIDHGPTSHLGWGIAGAAIGVLGNQVVARYKLVAGRRINWSPDWRSPRSSATSATKSPPMSYTAWPMASIPR